MSRLTDTILVAAFVLASGVALAQTPVPKPAPTPDLADQITRLQAAVNMLHQETQDDQQKLVNLTADYASIQAKLSNTMTQLDVVTKERDELKAAKSVAPKGN